ncbi:hypothetical protein GCM10010472_45200 [Pseudonocardia halophobica]|uniref:Uncharacterized protein n=1 Tax=Pseudonocardia halophobica TaxID=29401 RepID=A0A9W6P0U6_9PSEU|nr:hypothetical protein [Pseudonocardia halophobica]GLL15685.1 hypothetical protein GCM10017577_68380 [Pseudonocardia halophobica]
MTAQLSAPENVKALYTDASYEPTLEEWNWLVHEGGAAYKSELSARTVFESELFGMNTYILMSMMEDYLRVPERLRAIRRHATPAELVGRALPIGNKRSFINLAAMPLHYLTGRELFVDLGENSLSDGLEDQLEVLRFWREATIAMRTDGVLYNMHADPTNSSHVVDDRLLDEIRANLVPADEEVKTAIRKFGARLTAYAFLENCDARTAVCDTGPYQLEDGTFLALRETCADGDGDFPWLDGIRETLPYQHFVIAYRLPSTVQMDNNVWGTAWFTPSDYQADILETRVFCTDGDVLRPLDLAEIEEATKAIRKAHRALYQRLAETDPEERNLYATQMYAWKTKPWARLAGCYDEIDWTVTPRIAESYEKFSDPDLALQLIGGIFVPQDRDSCFRPLGG